MKTLLIAQVILSITTAVLIFWIAINFINKFEKDPCIRWSYNKQQQEFCLGK